jgi:hypothetical protein
MMIDVLFAMIAAGVNGADGQTDGAGQGAQAQTPPAVTTPATEAPQPEATAEAGTPSAIAPLAPPTVAIAPGSVIVGQGTLLQGAPATPAPAIAPTAVAPTAAPVASAPAPLGDGYNMGVVPTGLIAEPQTPSGKFTTALEVRPILNATKGSWIAVREYEGKDYLYVTHIWSWRCGLAAMAISVNGETMQNWPLPACHTQFSTPNAILEDDGNPLLTFKPGSVQNVTIQVVYDDLSMDVAHFARGDVLIP